MSTASYYCSTYRESERDKKHVYPLKHTTMIQVLCTNSMVLSVVLGSGIGKTHSSQLID